MTNEEIARHKTRLKEEVSLVEQELREIAEYDAATREWVAKEQELDVMNPLMDSNEAADKFEEYDEHRAEIVPLAARWSDLRAAIERIDEGAYGACETCGKEIEADRLAANPEARTCKAHL